MWIKGGDLMINVEQMKTDGVQTHLIFLAEMASASQFEKIAMNLENPQIFSQFLALDQDAVIWDYAYAAGLITRAEADLMKSYEIPANDEEDNGFPYTFNFTSTQLPDIPYPMGVCSDSEKWLKVWSSFGNGIIPTWSGHLELVDDGSTHELLEKVGRTVMINIENEPISEIAFEEEGEFGCIYSYQMDLLVSETNINGTITIDAAEGYSVGIQTLEGNNTRIAYYYIPKGENWIPDSSDLYNVETDEYYTKNVPVELTSDIIVAYSNL